MCTAVEPVLQVNVQECVGLLTISRPKALNALNDQARLVHLINNHLAVLPKPFHAASRRSCGSSLMQLRGWIEMRTCGAW